MTSAEISEPPTNATTRQPILSVRDAEKFYGMSPALRGISLDLFPGELLGFLGPNGAGKTTLIRCLAGRSKLYKGTIELFDSVETDQRTSRRVDRLNSIGFVPQTLALYSDLTVEQNLFAFGQLHGVPRRDLDSAVTEALRWADLADRRGKLASTLSGGMKRRLNIACSVLHEPAILLLDEPTVGVDPQSRERIYEMLSDLQSCSTAILLTTHQLDEAQHRCDRIAIVDQGQVIRVGTFDELVASTVGTNQRLSVRFRTKPTIPLHSLAFDETGNVGSCDISDVPSELPEFLESLADAGAEVEHVMLQGPTLQHVFLHLTGKELRE